MTKKNMNQSPQRSPLLRVRKALGHVRRSVSIDVFDFFTLASSSATEIPEPILLPDGYSMRFATEADVGQAEVEHTELDEREREEGVVRLGLGHRCISTFFGSQMVFSMWENPRNANVPGLVKRRLRADQSFLYKAYTSPEHRGRRLYQAGLAFALNSIAAEGKSTAVGYAHVKKRASRAGLARVGFGAIGRVRQLVAPRVRRTWPDRAFNSAFPEAVPRTDAVRKALALSTQEAKITAS